VIATVTEIARPSPRNKPVSLFVTCLVDMIFPHIGVSVVTILDRLGIEVDFPTRQICCAQPAFNAGFWNDARSIARNFLHAFADADLIVTPSGSCASMVQHYYPTLFKEEPAMYQKALRAASIIWEFTEYLVDGLGITDLEASVPPMRVGFHQACHGLRLMGLTSQAHTLAENIDGVTVVELPGADECCGFGGLFSVKMPEISGAMLHKKMQNIESAAVDAVITGDAGCLAQIKGGLTRAGRDQRVLHIADLLARGLG
jgi:L-lactate dehydrogenase complex protein LldE